MRVLMLAALYFAVVFGVGLMMGPVRVLWLEPRLGKTVAVLCELPVLLVAMVMAARWTTTKMGPGAGFFSFAAIGGVALILQQIADVAVGIVLRGITLAEQFAYFSTPAGLIYEVALLLFVTSIAAPVASGWSDCRVGLAPTGKRRLSRRTPKADVTNAACVRCRTPRRSRQPLLGFGARLQTIEWGARRSEQLKID
jgi:hypothetical protein